MSDDMVEKSGRAKRAHDAIQGTRYAAQRRYSVSCGDATVTSELVRALLGLLEEVEARAFPATYEYEDAPEEFDPAIIKAVTDCWRELEGC